MDTQDFTVTVHETWESIERAIDELALDGVESYPIDNGLRLMFEDGTAITLVASASDRVISIQQGDAALPFCYDEVEEHWYARDGEVHLLTALSSAISNKLPENITLPDLL